ncbi:MAG: sulfite exporter TauE/SafE family protein, partial [Chloroflexota bacterium]
TGFGFALVYAPLLAVAWEVKPAVATTAVLSLVVNTLVLAQVRGHVTTHRLPGLFAGFLAGVVPGLLVLEYVSGDTLEIIVGAVVLVATVLLYLQPQIDASEDTLPIRMLAGAASGASAASTGIGGPPVVLYMIGRELDMQRFRATLQAYFLPSSIVTLALFAAVGRIDGDVLTLSAASVPMMVAGVLLGAWTRPRISPELFRRLVMALLVAMSALLIAFTVFGIG